MLIGVLPLRIFCRGHSKKVFGSRFGGNGDPGWQFVDAKFAEVYVCYRKHDGCFAGKVVVYCTGGEAYVLNNFTHGCLLVSTFYKALAGGRDDSLSDLALMMFTNFRHLSILEENL